MNLVDERDKLSHVSLDVYGSIIWSPVDAMACTRPNLCCTVSQLSRFLNAPVTKQRWSVLKHVSRYIKGTLDFKLSLSKTDGKPDGFHAADWEGSVECCSTIGYCFNLGLEPNALISWKSKQ